jgi:rhamnose utilization protein RhaD (predicted bifunctional aldolase and dehydrogenase)
LFEVGRAGDCDTRLCGWARGEQRAYELELEVVQQAEFWMARRARPVIEARDRPGVPRGNAR